MKTLWIVLGLVLFDTPGSAAPCGRPVSFSSLQRSPAYRAAAACYARRDPRGALRHLSRLRPRTALEKRFLQRQIQLCQGALH